MTLERKTNLNFEKIKPSQELSNGDEHWFYFDKEVTGLPLLCLEDLQSGLVLGTVLSSEKNMRPASFKAWAGARNSRAPGKPWEIMAQMVDKSIDPDTKLKEMFAGYGHASVGDMASVQLEITNCPMHLCFELFNMTSINSGQEKSTRYQSKFGGAVLHPLNNYLGELLDGRDIASVELQYNKLGAMSLENFAKYKTRIGEAFVNYFKPTNDSEKSSLDSRVLDSVRSFLLFGQLGGMTLGTSARDFSRMIGELKASPITYYQRAGEQIQKILAPDEVIENRFGFKAEAPGLIRHTEPSKTVNENLKTLKNFLGDKRFNTIDAANYVFSGEQSQKVSLVDSSIYSEADKLIAEYFLILNPGSSIDRILHEVHYFNDKTKTEISKIILKGHNNYNELPNFAKTTGTTLIFESALGEVRDFNRHRAWGRFIPLPSTFGLPMTSSIAYQILASGYVLPLYITEIPEFKYIRQDMAQDMGNYYTKVYEFMGIMERTFGDSIDYSFVINLLPMAHKFNFWMHGDPKQGLYMTHQRVRPGGHINYRVLAYEANQQLADSDKYLEGIRLTKKPDPKNREEFFDRS